MAGIDVGVSINTDGQSPLHLAAAGSHTDTVELLCTNFPSMINRPDRLGLTPLHLASCARPLSCAGTLAEAFPKANTKPQEDISSLEVLLSHGANVNAQDKQGNTCLHMASAWGNLKAVRALMYAGVDARCSNYAGWLPQNYSLTVQAEVYFRNLTAEFERKKVEEHLKKKERMAQQGGPGLRLVASDEDTSDDAESTSTRSRGDSGASHGTIGSGGGLGIRIGTVDAWR